MSLFDTINADMKAAMKAKEQEKLAALRAIKSELLLLRTAGKGDISEDQELKMLQKMVKQRKESAQVYQEQNRTDLSEKELSEARHIEAYLPEQMSDEDLTAALKEIIAQTGASSLRDMGKVMATATKKLAGKADGKTISAKVKELLG